MPVDTCFAVRNSHGASRLNLSKQVESLLIIHLNRR